MTTLSPSLPEHQKGLLLTTLGVLVLTPDSLLVRLADIEPFTLLVWRGGLQALGRTYSAATRSARQKGIDQAEMLTPPG